MNRLLIAACFVVPAFFGSQANADITMSVVASPAPNFFTSPSWGTYANKAINSLENGLGNIGDRNVDPTAYEIFADGSAVLPTELIVSGFSSWRGIADQSSPFDGEFGNRVHFGIRIVGDGVTKFRLEDLSSEISSGDGNQLGFVSSFAGSDYSPIRFGIDYGANMVKGGGDDTIIDSGAGTQLVDEFVYVGSGNAYDASTQPGPSNQEKMDQAIASITSFASFNVTGSYTLTDSGGTNVLATGSTSFVVVPEPGSALLLFGLVGFIGFKRRRA